VLLLATALAYGCNSTTSGEPVSGQDLGAPDIEDTSSPDVGEEIAESEDTAEPLELLPPEATMEITEVMADSGHTFGGETVAILGQGFEKGSKVLFDGSEATNVLFITEERLHADTPPHPTGRVPVQVIKLSGEIAELDDAFLYFNEVTVAMVLPNAGPIFGGTPITVSGHGFSDDSVLIVGHYKALSTKVLDDSTILALTPPGAAGWADVIVSNSLGVNRLKDGFRYLTPPAIDLVEPAAGPTSGGTAVQIVGAGFEEPVSVWFGPYPAQSVTWVSEQQINATSPQAGAGIVDLRVDGAKGTAILDDAFLFHQIESTELQILHLSPGLGPVAGGTQVAITANQVGELDATSVLFGGNSAQILEINPETGTLVVETPSAENSGLVDVTLSTDNQETTAANAFHYQEALTVKSVSPPQGPEEGGTEITIKGSAFGVNSLVYVGALAAPEVTLIDATEIKAVTPAGSPGIVAVRAPSGQQQAQLDNAYTYQPEQTVIYAVVPNQGAIAGGTFVQVIGGGFKEESSVYFDDDAGVDVKYHGPGLLTVRTPPHSKGTVPVIATGEKGSDVLKNGFTYYDPKSLLGGTWGSQVDGSLNITVLDGATGQSVYEAFVLLDSDPETPYQGLTNAKGQITFSGPDLDGAHTIGVSKEAYVTYSVVHFDAENVTIFLNPIVDGQGTLDMIPPALVKGTVTGLGKYVVGTPGECPMDVANDPVHCSVCEAVSGDCEGEAVCADLGSSLGWHCLNTCTKKADCPPKHGCQPIEGGKHCVPLPGEKVAVCSGTKPYFRYFEVPLGPGAMADEDGKFSILTFPTEIAIVCFGGFYLKNDEPTSKKLENAIKKNPNYVFQPMVMGVARHLLLAPGEVAENVEVKLNIPLNRTIHARMEKPPLDDTDYLWTHVYLDFGSDGVIRMPTLKFLYNDEPFLLDAMPQELSGDIFDASYTFYAGANSYKNNAGYYYPKAYVVRQNVLEPQDDRMLRLWEGTWGTVATGVTESLQAAKGFSAKKVFTVGTGGSAYYYTGDQHVLMPTPTKKTLRGVGGSAGDNVWAVGDKGTVIHYDGVSWKEIDFPTQADLRDVFVAANGHVWVVGSYTVQERQADGSWLSHEAPTGQWHAIDGSGPNNLWIVGRQGRVRHFDGSQWTLKTPPTVKGLRDVAAISANNVWMVGEAGTLLHYNGSDFELKEPLTSMTLNGVSHRGANDIAAVGNFGSVFTYDGSAWVPAPATDYNQDLHAAVLPHDSSSVYTFGDHQLILGPIVAPAKVSVPKAGQSLTQDEIQWTADKRIEPHYQRIEILVPGMMLPILIWEFIADGTSESVPLPDFAAIQGTPGLSAGLHYLRITRVYQEGFDINNFDYTDLGSLDRQSWAVEYFHFTVPAP
jgi:photosystem II stability/assembly factor-like uncharacterized protein